MVVLMLLRRLLSSEEGQEFTNCLSYKPTTPGNIASRFLVSLVTLSLYHYVILYQHNQVEHNGIFDQERRVP